MSAPRTQSSFLDQPGPRVFTMPPGEPFLKRLAEGLCAAIAGQGDFALSDAMILAPTLRAARSLTAAFLALQKDNAAILLPRIRAIGDIDADEPPFEPGSIALDAPPAISAERRLFDLAALVHERLKISGQGGGIGAALAEAQALASLIDEAQTARKSDDAPIDFRRADEDFTTHLEGQPEHVQKAKAFLDIVMAHWPAHLAALGVSDPAERRSFVLRRLAQNWRQNPPDHIVIAAGSTGSVPATAQLLKVIAGLPKGAVILPGLDVQLFDSAWEEARTTPGHAQYGMAQLLAQIGIERSAVRLWPAARESRPAQRRRRLINEALLPANSTAGWLERLEDLSAREKLKPVNLARKALDGLALVEAQSEEEEALVLALAVRQTLQEPQKTAIVITPDRSLAQRVSSALRRWGIEIDDSAGQPLTETPVGVFLDLIAQGAQGDIDPVVIAALISNPLFGLGDEDLRQKFDALVLREPRHHARFDDICAYINQLERLDDQTRAALVDFTRALGDALAPLRALSTAPIKDFARAHVQAAETLATSAEKSGAARLWGGPAGESAAGLMRALLSEADSLGPLDGQTYWRSFTALGRLRPVRPRGVKSVRARILGPLEARMISADLVALGGLNENTWPAPAQGDPFLPRQLRLDLGLPDPERRLGLAAHDFAEHACKPAVLLTRARQSGGEPTVASRWIWRLKTLVRGACETDAEADDIFAPATPFLDYARTLDSVAPQECTPALPPAPKPPLNTRPRSLSVTNIDKLVRNPYAIYSKYILRILPLDPLGGTPGPTERGSAIHMALEHFIKDAPDLDAPETPQVLRRHLDDALKECGFAPYDIPVQSAGLASAVNWIIANERQRRDEGWAPVGLEIAGEASIITAYRPFTVYARADRIDQGPQGFAILDYKTGTGPTAKEVSAGFAPQLPLEGFILRAGGFTAGGKTLAGPLHSLAHVRLFGGKRKGAFDTLEKKSARQTIAADDLVDRAQDQLGRLINWFDDPTHPYSCQPQAKYTDDYSDYDLLARRPEWSATPEGDGDDND